VYRKASPNPELLGKDVVVHPGDTLQAGYAGAGRRGNDKPLFGVIASVDARGSVTLHLPEAPGAAVRLEKGKTVLPAAYELDDSPGFERFVLVTSEQPFPTDHVTSMLAAAGSSLPAGLAMVDLTLRKESQP